jgi:glycosyltransferase involved in cell wall biosynthesis
MSGLMDRLRGGRRPDVAFFHEFRRPPYGGSNQFLIALRGELERRGLRVSASRIGPETWACVLNAALFDYRRLRRGLRPGCRVVHRVDGPIASYRGYDDGTDERIAAINAEVADVTVFQSRYSLDAHRRLGIDLRRPTVIHNAVDPRIFHPPPPRAPLGGRRVRLISTSWSDNPNKGAAVYELLDDQLDWSRFEYTFVGRAPVRFRRIRTVPPVPSEQVAALLREHDVYLTASVNDPCSNSVLEGLACGLPAVYARSGGHPELVGEAGLGFADPAEIPALLGRLVEEYEERRRLIAVLSLAEVADRYLAAMRGTGEGNGP